MAKDGIKVEGPEVRGPNPKFTDRYTQKGSGPGEAGSSTKESVNHPKVPMDKEALNKNSNRPPQPMETPSKKVYGYAPPLLPDKDYKIFEKQKKNQGEWKGDGSKRNFVHGTEG